MPGRGKGLGEESETRRRQTEKTKLHKSFLKFQLHRLEPPDQGFSWEPFPGSTSNQPPPAPAFSTKPFPPPPPELPERKSTNSGEDNIFSLTISRETFLLGEMETLQSVHFRPLAVSTLSHAYFAKIYFNFRPGKSPSWLFSKINCSWGKDLFAASPGVDYHLVILTPPTQLKKGIFRQQKLFQYFVAMKVVAC